MHVELFRVRTTNPVTRPNPDECACSSIMVEEMYEAWQTKDMSSITLRGTDVISFLVYGAQIAAETASRSSESSEFCADVSSAILSYRSFTKLMKIPAFFDSLARGARAEWFPTLSLLRGRNYHLEILNGAFNDLIFAWISFGQALGLNESEERRRARASKRCSYHLCSFSGLDSPSALSTCKGCGQVRYCGKECQRGDWKNHKQICGKRLKEGAANVA